MMSKVGDLLFVRNHRVCPRWLCFTFDNWIRRRLQNPDQIIKSYVRAGDTVLDVGPGIGYFTIPMANKVGPGGKVIAADLQEAMLQGIARRAERAGVRGRIELYRSRPDEVYSGEPVDFILAFWMAHEVPDQQRFFAQLHEVLKNDGRFLLAEPKMHVSRVQFEMAITMARKAGFRLTDRPDIPLSLAALMVPVMP